ncbi:S8 family serine peptidase [Streptomyces sp. NBC_00094]|uniref:S8 family peptidase n=1 Tax=Streptomyces sp. NBC_00094 TaxID=2903620 RepID=UPI002250627C|nr:S8 family serine peptidase [Streptomyces sp. NBC_00094]MCX5389087.1 S8 family serine peptidase [Streptomyces sp. NBC_00094]
MNLIPRRRSVLAATATALAISGGLLLPPTAATAEATAQPSAKAGADAPTYDITLVTGDKVHYTDLPGADDVVTVDPAPGTGAVHVQRNGDDTYVIPRQAMSLLAADKLDQRLFNVTALVEMGYDDKRSGGIPVIATGTTARSAKPLTAPVGSGRVRELRSINAKAMKAESDEARAFWRDLAPTAASGVARTLDNGVTKLWLDGRVRASLSESVAQIGATQAWAKGFDGRGVKIAVLDTGIDATHPDMKDRIVASKSFITGEEADDKNGHGTHVASTIAGSGAASAGAKKGVAPGADLIIGKVLSNSGYGPDSGVIKGMEWAKAQGADIVSMSLGGGSSDGNDPISQAVNTLSANGGPLYVIAAGNAGGAGTVGAPGAAASALTVAAVDKSDVRASFSSQGPLTNSYGLKPDISAPGVAISAAASQSVPGWTGGMYRSMNGTSMATPHVAGAAAIVKQAHPDWDGARIKDALMSSSKKLDAYKPYSMGTGRVDLVNALDSTIEATGSVPAAVYKWPHAAAKPTERSLTYRNTGTADVTLHLTTGTPSPAYTLSASSVTVPAGGTVDVRLTLDPTNVAADTSFSGQVVATDAATGKVAAHTGYALHKERELYDFTIKLKGRDGKPVTDTVALTWAGNTIPAQITVDGERTLRLPPGTYSTWAWMDVPGDKPDSKGLAIVSDPETVMTDGPATAELDASKTNRSYAVTPRETEVSQTIVRQQYSYAGGRGGINESSVVTPSYDSVYLGAVPEVAVGTLRLSTHWRMREKSLDATTGVGGSVEIAPQSGGVRKDGTRLLRTVYAGAGAPADYAGLNAEGKAVIVDRTDAVKPLDRAKAAAEAGAAMLIVVNDGRGRLYEGYPGDHGLSVASVMNGQGQELIRQAKSGLGVLHIKEKLVPGYRYDLLQSYAGGVPDRALRYAPSHEELAEVKSTFYQAVKGNSLGGGGRYFLPGGAPGVGLDEYQSYPYTGTSYVSETPEDSSWYEGFWLARTDGPGNLLDERSPKLTYQAGRRYRSEWFKPVQAPRLGSGYWVPFRGKSNTVQWNVPLWSGSGAGHAASATSQYDGSVSSALYQGDTLLKSTPSQSGSAFGLRPEKLPYRLVIDATRPAEEFATSLSTHTELGFGSKYPAEGEAWQKEIELLNLTYDVDTDLEGSVRSGQRVDLDLGSTTYPGGIKATKAALEVSYDDGATWQRVELDKRADGRWSAELRTPRTPGGSVSLRASAEGPDGLWIKQDVIRAFGLK